MAAFLAVAITGGIAATTAGGADSPDGATAPTSAAAKCKRTVVNGKRVCLKKGERCKKAFQDDYLAAGLACRGGRLKKASLAQLRRGEPLLVDKQGQISLGTALAAFDSKVANLPGVKARKGEVGALDDATSVVGEIAANLDDLTPAQQDAFVGATTPDANAISVPLSDAPARPRAAAVQPARAAPNCAPQAETLAEEQLARSALGDAKESLVNHGWAVPRPVSLCFLNDQGGHKATTLAFVTPDDIAPGTSATCNIFVTRRGRGKPVGAQQYIYAHELAHCAQHALYSSKSQYERVPEWVDEGGADWLAGMIRAEHADTDDDGALHWETWFEYPETDLFERTYGALGFWAMVHQTGVDGWQRLKDATVAAASGGSTGAYSTAVGGLPDIFYMRWGPGLHMDDALGPEWTYDGPSIPRTKLSPQGVSNSAAFTSRIAPRGSDGATLALKAEVVTITASKDVRGLLRFEGEQRKLQRGAYCVKQGGCKCKTHANLALPKLGPTTYFGFGDAKKAQTVTFAGRSLKDYCKKPRPGPAGGGSASCPAPPAPQARRGGGGGAGSCPVSNGIMVLHASQGNPEYTQVALFKTADCTAGGSFVAIANDGDYRLEIGISGFSGFGQEYPIETQGADPTFVVDGPLGTYGNQFSSPVPGVGNGSGGINFVDGGRRFGFAFGPTWSAAGAAGGNLLLAGDATCIYPED